ncbi:MAG: hypothetical protein ACRD0C_06205 [Acidimicrobiia bacterium]
MIIERCEQYPSCCCRDLPVRKVDDPQFEAVGFIKDGVLVDADGARVLDPLSAVETLADWSPWIPFSEALHSAPRLPGVYLAREGKTGPVVYVGMAGERAGTSGRSPKGLRGRLAVYASGKALTSGLGEAVADRAFADAEWLRARIAEAERGEPRRAKEWGRAAFDRADLQTGPSGHCAVGARRRPQWEQA